MPAAASDAEAFNGWTSDGEPILPARLGKWRENKAELDTEGLREMLQRFRTGTDLGSAAPTHVMEFGEGYASNAVVVARLADETPLLLTRTFGAGEIVQSAVRFDPSSGLVTKRGFLPLMHEIAYSLARPASVTLDERPQEALTLLSKGRTTIMIAHRLSTLRDAGKLVVIENGKVQETGTHNELLVKKGTYSKLYTLQLEALKNIGVEE